MNNLLEFVLDTNPGSFTNYSEPPYNWRNEDDDGDGMPNGWEWDNGLPTHRVNTNEDTDGDGLTDYEEYLAGSDPQVSNKQLIQTIPGSDAILRIGSWTNIETTVQSLSRRGELNYSLTLQDDDIYLIEIQYTQAGNSIVWREPKLKMYLDDDYLGTKQLDIQPNDNKFVHFFTPVVSNGEYNIKIVWDNVFRYFPFSIKQICVYKINGPDNNKNGTENWIENKWRLTESLAFTPVESYISPTCIEEKTRFINLMNLTADSSTIPILHGAGDRWYANIPLSKTEPTETVISFQNNAKILNKIFYWKPLNILLSDDIMLRKGDSLLFTSHPENVNDGTMTIKINGDNICYNENINNPIAHKFETAGNFSIEGLYSSGAENCLTVTVIDCQFPAETPACLFEPGYQKNSYWDCPNVTNIIFIESGTNLKVKTYTDFDTGEISLKFSPKNYGREYITARLYENGPILTNIAIDVFMLCLDPLNCHQYIRSNVLQSVIIADNLPTNIIIEHIAIAGFFVGGGDIRELTSTNFNELGEYYFQKYPSESGAICNYATAYQQTSEGRRNAGATHSNNTGNNCAHPTNFRQVVGYNVGNGTLHFKYRWASSSGKPNDLTSINVQEFVTYNPITQKPYIPPLPFTGTISNPTITPEPPINGSQGTLQDDHKIPGISIPYIEANFIGKQNYSYLCKKCNHFDFMNKNVIHIHRFVEYSTVNWRYRITKSGIEATKLLP